MSYVDGMHIAFNFLIIQNERGDKGKGKKNSRFFKVEFFYVRPWHFNHLKGYEKLIIKGE
jgi:hypothetical protein